MEVLGCGKGKRTSTLLVDVFRFCLHMNSVYPLVPQPKQRETKPQSLFHGQICRAEMWHPRAAFSANRGGSVMLLCERTQGSDSVRPEDPDLSPSIAFVSDLIKSRQRVTDHGEVFTPPELVNSMIDLVGDEASRIESRILEPACGSGNFLVPIFERKLQTVRGRYGTTGFEAQHHVLVALMSVYGIELLLDNVHECHSNLLRVLELFLGAGQADECLRAAKAVLRENIVHGDAQTMLTVGEKPEAIVFAEWSYLGKGRFQRRDFRFDTLMQMSAFDAEGSLFAELGKHDLFTPVRDYAPLTIADLGEESP